MSKRIAFLTDSRGTLLRHVLPTEAGRSIVAVVSDRECGAFDVARTFNVETATLYAEKNRDFSDLLLKFLHKSKIDYCLVAFSRLLEGGILSEYKNRMFNIHPSLLPAFKGINAFERAIASGVRIVGDTYHIVDETMDGGPIVCQAAVAFDGVDEKLTRHRMFENECRLTIQLLHWLNQERVVIGQKNQVSIMNASYSQLGYSPGLDHPESLEFKIPYDGDLSNSLSDERII